MTYGPCTLKPENVHLRTSTGRSNVGFKARTSCSVRVTSIHHTSDLRHKRLLWWVKDPSKSGGNTGQKTYHQKNLSHSCSGGKRTRWGGTTLGTIIRKGKKYYARVYPTTNALNCGA